jgi:H-type small acid-soluble spore protein
MQINRVKDVLESRGNVKVFYQGHPVLIEEIDQESAHVRLMDNNQQLKVPINMLSETK